MTTVRHVGIVVSDIECSLRFYRDFLGLRVMREMDEAGPFLDSILSMHDAKVRTVKLSGHDSGCQVELLAFTNPPVKGDFRSVDLRTRGPTHIALTVSNLDQLHSEMVRSGVTFTTVPAVSPDGKAKVTFCRDPDGTYVELVEVLNA